MGRYKNKNIVFRQYFLNFILIFIIPVIIMSTLIFYYLLTSATTRTNEYSNEIVERVKNNLDQEFENIYATTERLNTNHFVNIFDSFEDDYYKTIKYYHWLKDIKSINSAYDLMAIIDKSSEYVISSEGTYSKKDFLNKIYHSDIEINELFEEKTFPYIFKSYEGKREYMVYCLPLSGYSSKNPTIVAYFIPYDYLDSVLHNNLQSKSTIIISDISNNYTYQSKDMEIDIENIDLKSISDDTMSFNGKKYVFQTIRSEVSRLSYVIFTPVSVILESVYTYFSLFVVSIIIIIIIGVLLSFFLAKRNYLPIQSISNLVKSQYIDDHLEAVSELDYIAQAFNTISGKVSQMSYTLEYTQNDVLYSNILKLLNGKFASNKELNNIVESMGIVFPKKYYNIAIFECHTSHEKIDEIIEYINKISKTNDLLKNSFCINEYAPKYLYFIFINENINENILEDIKNIKNLIVNQFACEITVGLSDYNIYFNEINTSFYKCLLALDYKYIQGKDAIINYTDVTELNNTQLPSFNYKNFHVLLLEGDKEQVLTILHDFYNEISNYPSSNYVLIKSEIFGILNFLHQSFPEIIQNHNKDGLMVINDSDTAEEFLNYICDLSLFVCDNIKTTDNPDKLNEIIEFVNNNYDKYDFTVQLVADTFNMSISSLSKYYKSLTGVTISDSVNELRIDKTKKLLLETDLNINEIVFEVGYSNSSSFIRRFKAQTGITPGKYRELYKEK